MSIWTRISEALAALTKGASLSSVFDALRTPPERSVGFTIAVIALGAKMAKADGQVTRDEVAAFREVFTIAPDDEARAAQVFNLARQDVAGYDAYARKIAAMFGAGHPALADLLEGLFHIALADGDFHRMEEAFLLDVSGIFGLPERDFRAICCRVSPDAAPDPWAVLNVPPDAPPATIRAAWKKAVRDNHPDQLKARGLPEEAVRLAEQRLQAVNRAWEALSGRRNRQAAR